MIFILMIFHWAFNLNIFSTDVAMLSLAHLLELCLLEENLLFDIVFISMYQNDSERFRENLFQADIQLNMLNQKINFWTNLSNLLMFSNAHAGF